MTISVGGEIGEVGTQNSTVEELRAYLDGYRRELDGARAGRHGHLQGQRPDRDVARRRAAARRRRGRGQARFRGPARARRRRPRVRAGGRRPARRVDPARRAVPPLPGGRDRRDPPRDRVPERALRAPGLPRSRSTARSRRGASRNAADERKPGQTDQQFVYTTRKKALGPFKRQLWELETKDEILAAQRRKISYLFTELRVNDSRDDGRAVRPAGRAPPADPRRPARSRRRPLTRCAPERSGRALANRPSKQVVDRAAIAVLSSRAGRAAG